MWITWRENEAKDKLYMEFTLNMYNMLDLATTVNKAADAAATLRPILQFYLTFLNNDSSTIVTLPYDAFVGLLMF